VQARLPKFVIAADQAAWRDYLTHPFRDDA